MSQFTATPRAATARVILIVRGGVAEVLHKPRALEVIIFDYDVEGSDPSDPCDRDPDGHACVIQTYGTHDKIQGPKNWPQVKTAASRLNGHTGHTRQCWRCPECGRTAHADDESRAEAGTPYCPHCDPDMEMT
jgi:hypothetical protein